MPAPPSCSTNSKRRRELRLNFPFAIASGIFAPKMEAKDAGVFDEVAAGLLVIATRAAPGAGDGVADLTGGTGGWAVPGMENGTCASRGDVAVRTSAALVRKGV